MGHFIRKCECGVVLTQCRCPDPNKFVEVVYGHCTHIKFTEATTQAITSDYPVTADNLLHVKTKFEYEYGKPANVIKVSQEVYNAISDYFTEKEREEDAMGIKKDAEYDPRNTLYGVQIKIDPTLKSDEWKFE